MNNAMHRATLATRAKRGDDKVGEKTESIVFLLDLPLTAMDQSPLLSLHPASHHLVPFGQIRTPPQPLTFGFGGSAALPASSPSASSPMASTSTPFGTGHAMQSAATLESPQNFFSGHHHNNNASPFSSSPLKQRSPPPPSRRRRRSETPVESDDESPKRARRDIKGVRGVHGRSSSTDLAENVDVGKALGELPCTRTSHAC
jgi:hypothetical protein